MEKKTGKTKRQRYIIETLKLKHDPFRWSTAELELQESPADPPFFSYFVPPPTDVEGLTLPEDLRKPATAVIFGDPGSGKTTLRYALELLCRAVPDGTLVVSFPIGKHEPSLETAVIWQELTQALATDLFVQLVEQFHILNKNLDDDLLFELSEFWQAAIPGYGRKLLLHMEREKPNALSGINVWWTTWQRVVTRYTPLSKDRQTFFNRLLSFTSETSSKPTPKTNELFLQGLTLAQKIGFTQLFYLIDVVSESKNQSSNLNEYLTTILKFLNEKKTPIPLYSKLFLSRSWQIYVNDLTASSQWLTQETLFALIEWNDPDVLQSIIANRFRSAGSWIRGFNAIASQDLSDRLDQLLIASAKQSPRRLLQLANTLINAHADRDSFDPIISVNDWETMRKHWVTDETPPASLNHAQTAREEK